MAIIVPMLQGLKTAVQAGWPEVVSAAIYRGETQEAIPWADIPVDAVVIVASNFQKTELGANQIAFAGTVQFLRVCKWGAAGQDDAAIAHLDTFLLYLLNNGIPSGQIVSYDGFDWGDEIQANSVVIAKNYNQRLIRLSVTVMIGYGG